MRTLAVLTATTLVSAGLLAGCGSGGESGNGSSSGGYCKDLRSSASSIKSFTAGSTPDFSKFSEFIDKAHDLGDKAPSGIKDDWKVLLDAMDALTNTLEDAGLKLEDIGTLMTGQLPEGVDQTKLAGLTTKLQEIGSEKVSKAADAISKQAKDTCKVDLDKVG